MTDEEYFEFIFSADDNEISDFYDSLSMKQLTYYRGLIMNALAEKMTEEVLMKAMVK